jgi:PIN domain nuclease of toxin-antitoxin system
LILLDTHIWIWWVHSSKELSDSYRVFLTEMTDLNVPIRVSAISCWEVAKLVERNRLQLHMQIEDWFQDALAPSGIQIAELTPEIAVESTRLPGEFHKDPADQIIVATARVQNYVLVTSDEKILLYDHVRKVT